MYSKPCAINFFDHLFNFSVRYLSTITIDETDSQFEDVPLSNDFPPE